MRKYFSQYDQTHYKTDPEYKITRLLRVRLYKALKEQGGHKAQRTIELLGCTIPELKQHLEAKFHQGMTWDNHGEWHIDHIRPCAVFDLTIPKQQQQCFHYTNLQPLWAEDNLQKSDICQILSQ